MGSPLSRLKSNTLQGGMRRFRQGAFGEQYLLLEVTIFITI
jgi:hypothetical protein